MSPPLLSITVPPNIKIPPPLVSSVSLVNKIFPPVEVTASEVVSLVWVVISLLALKIISVLEADEVIVFVLRIISWFAVIVIAPAATRLPVKVTSSPQTVTGPAIDMAELNVTSAVLVDLPIIKPPRFEKLMNLNSAKLSEPVNVVPLKEPWILSPE